jgi:hypothetical protein
MNESEVWVGGVLRSRLVEKKRKSPGVNCGMRARNPFSLLVAMGNAAAFWEGFMSTVFDHERFV